MVQKLLLRRKSTKHLPNLTSLILNSICPVLGSTVKITSSFNPHSEYGFKLRQGSFSSNEELFWKNGSFLNSACSLWSLDFALSFTATYKIFSIDKQLVANWIPLLWWRSSTLCSNSGMWLSNNRPDSDLGPLMHIVGNWFPERKSSKIRKINLEYLTETLKIIRKNISSIYILSLSFI